MNLSDNDLELLDRYLDGDLNDSEQIGLEARLKVDAGMKSELAKMREFRSMRAEAFASMEPTDIESKQLEWYVRGALHQQQNAVVAAPAFGEKISRWTGSLSRLAAVLLVGLMLGYLYRGGGSPINPGGSPIAVNPSGAQRNLGGMGPIMPVSNGTPVQPAGYDVMLTDQAGNVVATQRFPTLREAQEFTNDLGKLQQKRRQVQNNGIRLIGDDF